ncbi:MAG: copper oxidase, partial [Beijerinckiaceae bacterium]
VGMAMGTTGMAMGEMAGMEMPMPDNTLPMMTGTGQFGPIEMGGMFTVMKIREGLARDDYKDPGPYKNPRGTVAHAVDVDGKQAPRQESAPAKSNHDMKMPGMKMPGMKMP